MSDSVEFDPVKKAKHYNSHPSGIECITIIEEMTFNVGNAMKYLWRAGLKGNEDTKFQDLDKAMQYIDYEIKRLKRKK